MQTELATQEKQLQHESHGLGRGRTLTIRMERKATLGGIDVGGTPTKRAATFLDTTPDLVSGDWNTAGSSSPPRTGHVLGHVQGTPPKRPRSVPANVAAANAAMVRQALFQSKQAPIKVNPPRRPTVQLGSAQCPLTLEDDSEEEVPRKPAAIHLIVDVEEEGLQRKPAAFSKPRKKPPPATA
jgi:hypothetical protein